MTVEHNSYQMNVSSERAEPDEFVVDKERAAEIDAQADEFNLNAFFSSADTFDESEIVVEHDDVPELLVSLRNNAQESIDTITSTVTATSFTSGVALTSSVFSSFGALVGSCGVVCGHTLSSIGQLGTGVSGATQLGGVSLPGFAIDANGNFTLEGDLNSLSKLTGYPPKDLLSGKYSVEEILGTYLSVFGESCGYLFGFGFVESFIGGLFDCFLPRPSGTQTAARAA